MSRKRVLVLCPSPKGTVATQRLKYEQYLNLLEEAGFKFTISSFQSKYFYRIVYNPGRTLEKIFWTIAGYFRRIGDLLRAPFYDAVFVNLWVTPIGPPIFESLLFLFNKQVIYDIDDMLFIGPKDTRGGLIQRLKGRRKPLVLMEKAQYVIVCTPKLEEIARSLNRNESVVDISSTFDTERFIPVDKYDDKKRIVIGWTGTHSTIPYLESLQPVLSELSKIRDIMLLVIANKEYVMPGVPTTFCQWKAESEVKDLHQIDIGLYPIPANEWSLGKSSLKALTYMAIAIPFVATAYGTNYRIMEHGAEGFMASNEQEWLDYLIQLVDNPELRKQMGLLGRKTVESKYSVEANFPKYLEVFEEVAGQSSKFQK